MWAEAWDGSLFLPRSSPLFPWPCSFRRVKENVNFNIKVNIALTSLELTVGVTNFVLLSYSCSGLGAGFEINAN